MVNSWRKSPTSHPIPRISLWRSPTSSPSPTRARSTCAEPPGASSLPSSRRRAVATRTGGHQCVRIEDLRRGFEAVGSASPARV
ncbi:hypothetical protein Vadar_011410 [Vaccinium darrowii]|uniref:Uncharacterized protein n=1 Tax=Vaccinium darrowii TaxID=229202 RepID=A0ACB7XQ28_9ERIC|nr:hypothetical protein Vadar_011410 [Vaccinium darrowii]